MLTRTIDTDIPLVALYNQLERDVTAAFVPKSTVQAYTTTQAQPTPEQAEPGQEKQEKKEKKVEQVFYAESQGEHFIWSFITTGGVQTIQVSSAGAIELSPSPGICRVAYILQKDERDPNLKKLLYRYTTDNLDLAAIKGPDFKPTYELLSGIKTISLEFTVFKPVQAPAAQANQQPKQPEQQKPVATKVTSWQEQEMFNEYKSLIPAYITLRGTYSEPGSQAEHSFEFSFKIMSYRIMTEKPKSTRESTHETPRATPQSPAQVPAQAV